MGRARGANALMNIAFETAYGTPPAGGYKQVPFITSALGAEQALMESDLLGQGRAPSDPMLDVVTNDGDVVVPVDAQAFGWWLRLLFGAPTTAADGDGYAHTFKSGAPTIPSLSAEIGHPDVPAYSTNYGLRANTFQIQMGRSGWLNATLGLIGQGETVLAATSSAGVPTPFDAATNRRFTQPSGQVLMDDVQIGGVMSATISFSNVLEKVETIRPSGEIEDSDPGMPTASLGLTMKFADRAMFLKATSGTPVKIVLGWTIPGANRMLRLELNRVFLPRSKRPITGPAGIQVSVNAIAATAAGQPMLSAYLRNDVASYA